MSEVVLLHRDGFDDMVFELRPTRGRRKWEAPLSLRFEWLEGANADGMVVVRPLELWELYRLKALVDECLDDRERAAS